MDKCFDHYFSSCPSMSDMRALERSSWECEDPYESDELLANSLSKFENNEQKKSHGGGDLGYVTISDFFSGGAQIQNNVENPSDEFSNGMLNGQVKCEHVAECTAALPSIGSYTALQDSRKQESSKVLPEFCDGTNLSFLKTGFVGCNGIEPFEIDRSFSDLPTLSSVPEILPHSHGSVYSLPNILEGDRMLQGFNLRGGNMENGIGIRSVETNKILQPDNLSASIITKEIHDLPSSLQTASTPINGCNGTGKPRARARRGQATDPHSIAERLRREKIAERMKNLQELVPNSTKTDKASMLDEIIEYVKFLQLQVKVLSMSRLGAAEAVVPLITDGHSMGSNGLSLTQTGCQGVEFSPSADQIVFEQEAVKLMESSMSKAMQYLQSKGLCLMPMALAAAISKAKASSSPEKFGSLAKNNSSSSSSDTGFSSL